MPLQRRKRGDQSGTVEDVNPNGVTVGEKNAAASASTVKRSGSTSWRSIAARTALFCLGVYFLIPAFAPLVPFISKQFLYLCLFKTPFSSALENPESQNISGARNLKIGTLPPDESIKLGMWQILPWSLSDGSINQDGLFDAALSVGKPVILYLHGNAGTRAAGHRLVLYQRLVEMDFHVVALDYRGFGDSSGWPTADGVVNDAESAYRWVQQRTKDAPIYVWGHSMGSGIGSAMVKRLCDSGSCPQGLILESPYNSMHDAMHNHPFTVPWWILPICLAQFSKAYVEEEAMFNSQENLKDVRCPVLIIHAEDDSVVPYKLGKRLYEYSVQHRDKSFLPVRFHSFGSVGCGHRHIVDSPDFPDVVRNFVK